MNAWFIWDTRCAQLSQFSTEPTYQLVNLHIKSQLIQTIDMATDTCNPAIYVYIIYTSCQIAKKKKKKTWLDAADAILAIFGIVMLNQAGVLPHHVASTKRMLKLKYVDNLYDQRLWSTNPVRIDDCGASGQTMKYDCLWRQRTLMSNKTLWPYTSACIEFLMSCSWESVK